MEIIIAVAACLAALFLFALGYAIICAKQGKPVIAYGNPGKVISQNQPNTLNRTWWLILLYSLGLIIAVTPTFLPLSTTIPHFLYEDFFYYLKIARNAITGHGITLDGVEPTNGFHPLWMMLCVFAQVLGNEYNAISIVMLLSAMLHIGQAAVLFRILSRSGNRTIAHMASLFWLLNYRALACNVCGMETPLAVFFLLLLISFMDGEPIEHSGRAAQFGLLLGCGVAARFDLLLVVPFALAWIIVGMPDASPIRRRVMLAAMAGCVCILVLAPWLVWSHLTVGAFFPNSQHALALFKNYGFDLHAPLIIIAKQVLSKIQDANWWLSDTGNALGLCPLVLPSRAASAVFSWMLIAIYMAFLPCLVIGLRSNRRCSLCLVLWLYAASHFGYYVFFARAEVRYLMPFVIITIIIAASVAQILMESQSLRDKRRRFFLSIAFAAVSINCLIAGWFAWHRHQGATRSHVAHLELYETAQSLHLNLPPKAVIGSWNAGIMSYFSGFEVVNLDGVVNEGALHAMAARPLESYMKVRGVTHIVDFDDQIPFFMDRFAGNPDWRHNVSPLYSHRLGRVLVLRNLISAGRQASSDGRIAIVTSSANHQLKAR